MRKLLLLVLLFFGILGALILFVWGDRVHFSAAFLSRQLGVPVRMEAIEMHTKGAFIEHLWIGNPPRSQTTTAFSAESIDIDTTLQKIFGHPLLIEEILVREIFVGIEYYDSKKQVSNWNVILQPPSPSQGQPGGRDYLIRTLRLENLKIEVTHANGKIERYSLPQMEFHNLTSETGFPVDEIEKAIFQQMMLNLIQQFHLDQILDAIRPLPLPMQIPSIPFFP